MPALRCSVAPWGSLRLLPGVPNPEAFFASGVSVFRAGVLPMPKRNNTNQPVSDSLRRFSADTTCQYVYCAVSAKNHPQILRSQVEQSRAADFCCDKETGAANTLAVLARRMAQSRRKSVPPDLLRVILLWHSDAACRPTGLRLRKRCRHFAVPSPLGLLTTPAARRECCTRSFPGWGKIRRGKVS